MILLFGLMVHAERIVTMVTNKPDKYETLLEGTTGGRFSTPILSVLKSGEIYWFDLASFAGSNPKDRFDNYFNNSGHYKSIPNLEQFNLIMPKPNRNEVLMQFDVFKAAEELITKNNYQVNSTEYKKQLKEALTEYISQANLQRLKEKLEEESNRRNEEIRRNYHDQLRNEENRLAGEIEKLGQTAKDAESKLSQLS